MAASTVIRVKRRLEENPQDALVLMCKRKKSNSDAEISPSLFVFRGTVENQETKQVHNILPKGDIKLKCLPNVDDIVQKLRKERVAASAESRYDVVNCSRGIKNDCDESKEKIDLFDLQPKKLLSEVNDSSTQFVYDLYTPVSEDPNLDDIFSIEDYSNFIALESYRDGGKDSESSDNSDDSNDENNWRNDYPDSEHSSINDEDMINAMSKCDIEDNLSSDDGEDRIYDNPNLAEDVLRYGPAYAKYKFKILSEDPGESALVHTTFMKGYDEENIEGYKDESDDGFYYAKDDDSDEADCDTSDPEFCEPD